MSPVASGISHPLAVPLDGEPPSAAKPSVRIRDPRPADAITPPRRPPSRRDSLKRREALLKGNEGSRQRRRWENGTPFCLARETLAEALLPCSPPVLGLI